jgi:Secretion system C-terminal sorting domain
MTLNQIILNIVGTRSWRILILLFVSYCEVKPCVAQAQPPSAPKNIFGITRTKLFLVGNIGSDGVKRSSLISPTTFDVEYDSVKGATSYLLDVAEDSLFTQFLPGLRNYSVRFPFHDCKVPQGALFGVYGTYSCLSDSRGKGDIRVVGLLQGGKQYFIRLRAVNSTGESPFSSSASVSVVFSPFSQAGYTAYPFSIFSASTYRFLSARVQHLTDTSVTFNFYARDSTRPQATVNGQNAITSTRGNTVTVMGLRSGTTNTISLKATFPPAFSFGSDSLVFRLRPFSRDMMPFGKIIEYYEGSEYPGQGADSLYFRVELFPNSSISAVEDTLRSLRSQRFEIDTAWYNTGGFITCIDQGFSPCSRIDEAYPSLLIKLRRKDPRISTYRFPLDAWRYSDEAIFYRFSFGGTVVVGAGERDALPLLRVELLQNRPNPFGGETTLEYVLPERSAVRIEIVDMLGRRVAEPVSQIAEVGRHSIALNLTNLANGMYLARMYTTQTSGKGTVKTIQMSVVK